MHILPALGPGGAEKLVVELIKALDRQVFESTIVSLYPEAGYKLEKDLKDNKHCVYYLNKHLGLDPSIITKIYRLINTYDPHVVHTHLYVLRYALLPVILCHVPACVHTVHNIAQKEVDRIGKIVHWIAFRYGRVIPVSISQEVKNSVRSIYGQNIYTPVIYNGIYTEHFIKIDTHKIPRMRNDLVLLHIGRFAPQKNHALLIEAFSLAVKEFPKLQLWLVGDGPLKDSIRSLVNRKKLEEKIYFLGIRSDVPELMSQADSFILSSNWEGVPLSVLEALAAGVPVICTAVGGVRELIDDGVEGILVPPNNPMALSKGILFLAKDLCLRQRMGRAGRKKAIERFDISRTAIEYESLYIRILDKQGLI